MGGLMGKVESLEFRDYNHLYLTQKLKTNFRTA